MNRATPGTCETTSPPALVELFVADLKLDPRDGTAVIVLFDRIHHRAFPLWVADSAAAALGRQRLGRGEADSHTDSHALLFHTIEMLGAAVEHVELTDVVRGVVAAHIAIFDGEGPVVLPARASDAVVLAVRAGAPIMCSDVLLTRVHARVLDAVARSQAERHGAAEPIAQSPAERWSQLLAHLSKQNVGKIYEG